LVEEDPRLTVRELANELSCSVGTIHTHLHDIGKVKLSKWVPHLLSERNKADRVRIAYQLLTRYREGRLKLDDILTSDEKWRFYANVIRRRERVDRYDSLGEKVGAKSYFKR